MTVEHKFISFASFKARTEGPGGWEGYLSKTGEIDDGGDLILQGAYTDTTPDFLARGFNAESHDWTFSRMIGFPLSAKEDDEGLYVVSQYHSTADAQLVRTKAQERLAAGKGVYMSIGYEPGAPPIFIEPAEYAEKIPQYSRKGLEEQNMLKALQFPVVRVIPKIILYEGSIVSVPMLRSAEVTAVKSLGTPDLGTGLEYNEHARWLGTAIGEFAGRTEARAEMRTKEGRVLSQANYDELVSLWERLGALLESAKPRPKEDATEATKAAVRVEHIRFLLTQAQALGVKIT